MQHNRKKDEKSFWNGPTFVILFYVFFMLALVAIGYNVMSGGPERQPISFSVGPK